MQVTVIVHQMVAQSTTMMAHSTSATAPSGTMMQQETVAQSFTETRSPLLTALSITMMQTTMVAQFTAVPEHLLSLIVLSGTMMQATMRGDYMWVAQPICEIALLPAAKVAIVMVI